MAEHISDKLVELIVSELSDTDEGLNAGLASDTVAEWAHVIRGGLLQENPLVNKVSVTVHMADPDEVDPSWNDELASPSDPYVPNTPTWEIGGTGFSGIHWWRRGCVKIDMFFLIDRLTRDEARQQANTIRARTEQILGRNSGQAYLGLTDDYDEKVIVFMVNKSFNREGGGPSQLIWRAKVWWSALTTRP
jgi:hypothetical protein